jgi:peptide/nickel transport system substrate-binding protein
VLAAVGLLSFAVGLGGLGVEDAPGTTGRDGGTLLAITPPPPAGLGFAGTGSTALDPGLAVPGSRPAIIWHATCAMLPEAADGPPVISRDGRTYVFRVRRGLRFSNGTPLTGRNFARALGRVLDPGMRSPVAFLYSDVRRVSAHGLTVRIELRKSSGDLSDRLALAPACPVPLDFPVDPAGVTLTVGSGPYFVASYVPDHMIVLKRNPYYRGSRSHHVDQVVVTIAGDVDQDISAVEDGRSDVLMLGIPSALRPALAERYGVNREQLFRTLGLDTGALIFNTSGPLFKENAALRKAVNFVLDRAEIVRATPGGFLSRRPTDQIMPSRIPGWRDYHLYPLAGPNLRRALTLAQGNLRGGRAVLWTTPATAPGRSIWPAETQVIVSNLRAIGLGVDVQVMAPDVLDAKAGIPGARYDMLLSEWPLDYADPGDALIRELGGQHAREPSGNRNFAYFNEPAYDRRMAAADRLHGAARLRAFSKLDADIMRNEAPWAPLYQSSGWLLVSKRVSCVGKTARVDFAAMCLR